MVLELLSQSRYPVSEIFAVPAWLATHGADLTQRRIPFQSINERELAQISQLSTPNQVLAIINKPNSPSSSDAIADWVIYLDGLQDPGNVGTILRIADWFAIPQVIFGPGTVDLYNAKTLQATMGAFLRVECVEAKLETLLAAQPGLACWGADMGGTDIFQLSVPPAGILVIGNEGKGLQPDTQAALTETVAIAAPPGSGAESLNAGVACGILCAALRRGEVRSY